MVGTPVTAGGVRRAAVLGHPIAHSLSPVLHRAAYRALGLSWRYDAVDVTEGELPSFLSGLDGTWAGLSLTMPLKVAVLPLLASATDTVAAVGGANTVVFTPRGPEGHNTDVFGIVQATEESAGFRPPATVSIVGAGATAAAALVATRAWQPATVRVCARRSEAAAELAAHGRRIGCPAEAWGWERRAEALAADLVVVTLPGDAAAPLADDVPPEPGLLFDVTYHPWPTTVAAAWSARGATVVPGHRMLLWQAVRQVELMTGHRAPVAAMIDALNDTLTA